jgi:S-adenosyl methyltransferase
LVSAGQSAGNASRRDDPLPFNTGVAQIARVYDYGLGGKDNFAADRAAGDQVLAAYPDIVTVIQANRAFLGRAVRYLAAEAGIRQFLDIGVGMPAANNTHEVAQSVAPQSRIVYVDNNPVVLAHARALLVSGPAGVVAYLDADVRDKGQVVAGAARTLDFSQPVAVVLTGVLPHFTDDEAYPIVAALRAAVPPGSYLAISHLPSDVNAEAMARMVEILDRLTEEKGTLRDRAGVARFFEGMEMVEPGLVLAQQWRPDIQARTASPSPLWCAVGRKPPLAP